MKFFVTYQMPHAGLDEWMKLPEEVRKADEEKMQGDWNAWMAAHAGMILETAGVGKPKRVDAAGVTDVRNDIMMYSFVEGESLEMVADTFKDHPHYGIPGAWIEIMAVNKSVN
ncbi:MAG: hypothetical protein RLZZ360_337 [Candidatus Parcubacteria bacterium]|jgi:hypothetical protein